MVLTMFLEVTMPSEHPKIDGVEKAISFFVLLAAVFSVIVIILLMAAVLVAMVLAIKNWG